MRILYIDPITGLSGDMLASAIVHLGFPKEKISEILARIPSFGISLNFEEKKEGVISGLRMKASISDHRLSISEMRILASEISSDEKIREEITEMLDMLLDLEAKLHGFSKDNSELHELASIDTILDLAIFAYGLSHFGVSKVYCGPIPHGFGLIETSHGKIPNPPPLTLELLKGYSSVFHDLPYELTTPTGALIIRYYVNPKEKAPPFRILSYGYGFGNYEMGKPDILRVILGEVESETLEEINVIEFDVDDMEMEYTGFFSDSLRRAGARDVSYQSVYMKKGRIGIRFSILCEDEKLDRLKRIIFEETSTFGIRLRKERREILRRDERVIETPYGDVRVKLGFDETGKLLKEHVEFDDVVRISEAHGIPYSQVLKEVKRRLWKELTTDEKL